MLVENNEIDNIYIKGNISQSNFDANKGRQLTSLQRQKLPIMNEEISWIEIVLNDNPKLNANFKMTIDSNLVNDQSRIKVKFIKNSMNGVYPNSFDEYLNKINISSAIEGKGFSEDKKEIYISERYLETIGFDIEAALDKNVSLSIDYSNFDFRNSITVLDNDLIYNNVHANYKELKDLPQLIGEVTIFSDYKIVGIIKKEYYQISSLTKEDADIWFKYETLIDNDGNYLMPQFSKQDLFVYRQDTNESKTVLTYKTNEYVDYSKNIAKQGCFFPFLLGNYYISDRGSNNNILPVEYSYVQCNNFNESLSYVEQCNLFIKENTNNSSGYYTVGSNIFVQTKHAYICLNAIIIFAFDLIVVFVVVLTILNNKIDT